MTDERLLWLIKANSGLENPEVLLAALRAEGYDLYRPDNCTKWHFDQHGNRHGPAQPEGDYFVVPVGGDS